MSDPFDKRKFKLTDWILVLLAIFLLYILYLVLGGDLNVLSRLRTYSGSEGPLEQVINSLSGFGQGISEFFGGLIR